MSNAPESSSLIQDEFQPICGFRVTQCLGIFTSHYEIFHAHRSHDPQTLSVKHDQLTPHGRMDGTKCMETGYFVGIGSSRTPGLCILAHFIGYCPAPIGSTIGPPKCLIHNQEYGVERGRNPPMSMSKSRN